MAPNTWPGWESVRLLGEGSYGCVYEIKKEEFGQQYRSALKVIEIPYKEDDSSGLINNAADSRDALNRYYYEQVQEILREVQLMASLQGVSNIVSYEDHKIIPKTSSVGYYFLIRMELLTPLRTYMANVPINDSLIVKLGSDICRALEYCERNDILHRDIKPANIFISRHGDFKLGDFGIARCMADANTLMTQRGTARYIAPEIYRGGHYGFEVDIYSLGLVLYQYMNENRPPFCSPDETSYFAIQKANDRRLQGDVIPPPVHGSEALKKVILRAVEFSPEKRYSSAADFRKALESALSAGSAENTVLKSEEKSSAADEGKPSISENLKNTAAKKTFSIRKFVPVLGTIGMLGISLFVMRLIPSLSKPFSSPGSTTTNDIENPSSGQSAVPSKDPTESPIAESGRTESTGTESENPSAGGWSVQKPYEETEPVEEVPEPPTESDNAGSSSESTGSWGTNSIAGNSRTNKTPSARVYTLSRPDSFSVDIKIDGISRILESSDSSLLISIDNNDLHRLSFELEGAFDLDQENIENIYENLYDIFAENEKLPEFEKHGLYTENAGDFKVWTMCFSYRINDDDKYPIYIAVAISMSNLSDNAGLEIQASHWYEKGEKENFFQTVHNDCINAFQNLTINN